MNEKKEYTVKEAVDYLIDKLILYGGSEVGRMYLNGFLRKYGEVPDEYKEAIKALMEM